jgi:hypothetical protein
VSAGAIAYLLDQAGEAGHACPVACTAGAIKLLQRVGSEEQRSRLLPPLLERDFDRRVHAAQFVTEVQGGSDVGANACVAVPEPGRPGWFRISGEKWFCSVADAGVFVVSARPAGAPAGTAGLGLFLVSRTLDGRPNGFALRRLKWKLGTRTMATAEIDFDGALGEAVGPLDDGFRNLVGIVLDTSRVHNALAACGIMRGAWTVARAYAGRRRAFGAPIGAFPAVQELLARVRLRGMAGLAATFRVLDAGDRLERGEAGAELAPARRIDVMLGKYWTARAASACARDAVEVLGGNGTIEDFSPLPRLVRDALVVESWEGTHNTLCAQVLRDFRARGLHRPWLARLAAETAALDGWDGGVAAGLLADLGARVERLVGADPARAAADVRHVANRACRLVDWLALATQARWEAGRGAASDTATALELYRLAVLERRDPLDAPELADLHRRLAGGEP